MRELEVDVVSVGSGGGGLAAALTAADAGASVVVLEKSPQIGGVLAYSDGQVWCGANHLAEQAGMPDTAQETSDYLDFLSQGVADPALRDNFIARGPEAIRFFCEHEIDLQVVPRLPDYYHPLAPGTKAEGRYMDIVPFDERRLGPLVDLVHTSPHGNGWLTNEEFVSAAGDEGAIGAAYANHFSKRERCTGAGLAASLVKACADRGVEFRPATPAVELAMHNDRVTGVVAQDESGERIMFRARSGVVLATGGYDHSPAFMKTFELVDDPPSMAPPSTTGDHLTLAGQIGASIVKVRPPQGMGMDLGFHTPDEQHFGKPKYRFCLPGMGHSILVNARGRRYVDDGAPPVIKAACWAIDEQGGLANWPTWLIVDQTYRDKYSLGAVPPGEPLPDGMAVEADTVRGVAEAAGIDPDGLEETIERWNDFCAGGVDEDFGRGQYALTQAYSGPDTLAPIDKPPFVAVKQSWVGLNTPAAGVEINADAEVVTGAGTPIPGLFAAGNAAALLDIGAKYQSGLGNSRGLAYGYTAARKMAV